MHLHVDTCLSVYLYLYEAHNDEECHMYNTMDQKLIMLDDTWLLSVHLYLYEPHDEDEGHVNDGPEVDLVHVG